MTLRFHSGGRGGIRLHRLCAIAAMMAAPLSCATTPGADVIVLDPGTRYQTMRGWEAHAAFAAPCRPHFTELRDQLIRVAVHDVGIDRLRVAVRSGAENRESAWLRWVQSGCHEGDDPSYQAFRANRYATVNDNADPHTIDWRGFDFTELDWIIEQIVLPYRRELEGTGKQLFVNLNCVAFIKQIRNGSYHHHDPEEYAEFVLATFLHLRDKYGLVPDTWEPLLEPDNVPGFDGKVLGRAMAATAARLREHGFTPRFVAPSTTRMDNAARWFDDMATVPGAIDDLVEISYHRYGGVSPAALRAIADRAVRFGKATAMLEWWFGNATRDVLIQDLTLGRNSSWQGRTLGSLVVMDGWQPGRALPLQPDVRFNRQYFRAIDRGAVRIGAAAEGGSVKPVAFINPDGGYAVIASTTGAAELTVRGLPPGAYQVRYTTERADDVALPAATVAADGVLTTRIPAAGVIAVRAAAAPVTRTSQAPSAGTPPALLPR